jgi:predicted RNase H-like HicB family nuclease
MVGRTFELLEATATTIIPQPNVVTIPGHAGDRWYAEVDSKGGGIREKTMSVRYAVIFEQAECNWAAYVPDLPGCITTGRTLEEAELNIREAIEGHLKTLREFGDRFRNPRASPEILKSSRRLNGSIPGEVSGKPVYRQVPKELRAALWFLLKCDGQ